MVPGSNCLRNVSYSTGRLLESELITAGVDPKDGTRVEDGQARCGLESERNWKDTEIHIGPGW
jgi:hypothetical protein